MIGPAATGKALTLDGWFLTGDMAEKDSEGFIYIRDRSECDVVMLVLECTEQHAPVKDMIIRGGENIVSGYRPSIFSRTLLTDCV